MRRDIPSQRKWLLLPFLLVASVMARGQNPCPNIDFEMGNFTNWQGELGTCCPINTTTSTITPNRHTIMSGTGTDPNTCNMVRENYPNSGSFSARLGNDNSGREAERLSYTFLVPDNSLFVYRYAVVLEDPSHDPDDQPRFQIRVLNSAGQLIDPICGYYSVVADANIPGFMSCNDIRYKNWTTVGIDLSAYEGQNVTVEFSTGDCDLGAHFGYAYIDALCSSLTITNSFCSNSSIPATLTAPEGFSYLWSTGATTRSISIMNPTPGTNYSVVLTSVTGCTATLSSQITATVVNSGFYTQSLCSKQVEFFDSSSAQNDSIVGWLWHFGDGGTSTDRNPIHAYPHEGSWPVTLIAYTSQGCSDTLVQHVEVIPSPNALVALQNGCTGMQANLVSASTVASGSIVAWNWELGNGLTSAGPSISYAYPLSGFYNVKLSVVASNGCADSINGSINILDFPVIHFSADDTLGCNPFEVQFTDHSTQAGNTTLSWQWNFGDSTTSTAQHPLHVYQQAGVYTVSLSATNGNGCTTSLTVANKIIVQEHPVARFTIKPEELTIIYPRVEFFNQSIHSDAWEWHFGDSVTMNSFNAVHTYMNSGSFLACLVASNTIGCMDTSFREILVKPEMVLYAPTAFTPNGDGRNETFYLPSTSVAGFSLIIYNRWGQKIFETNNPRQEWNGQYMNTGAASPPGLYYWIAEATDAYGNTQDFSGSVTLVR